MRAALAGAALLLGVAAAVPARAVGVPGFPAPPGYCVDWTHARLHKEAWPLAAEIHSVIGNIQGASFVLGVDLSQGVDGAGLVAWLDRACAARPGMSLGEAEVGLLATLAAQHGVDLTRYGAGMGR